MAEGGGKAKHATKWLMGRLHGIWEGNQREAQRLSTALRMEPSVQWRE